MKTGLCLLLLFFLAGCAGLDTAGSFLTRWSDRAGGQQDEDGRVPVVYPAEAGFRPAGTRQPIGGGGWMMSGEYNAVRDRMAAEATGR